MKELPINYYFCSDWKQDEFKVMCNEIYDIVWLENWLELESELQEESVKQTSPETK